LAARFPCNEARSFLLTMGMQVRPLFIPLKTEYFNAFLTGQKNEELRLYGPRWNERTCPPGRRVILSKGYGKQYRIEGTIWEFRVRDANTFGSTYKASVHKLYGTLDKPIAEIRIRIDQPVTDSEHQ
jgi:hypothetical protein